MVFQILQFYRKQLGFPFNFITWESLYHAKSIRNSIPKQLFKVQLIYHMPQIIQLWLICCAMHQTWNKCCHITQYEKQTLGRIYRAEVIRRRHESLINLTFPREKLSVFVKATLREPRLLMNKDILDFHTTWAFQILSTYRPWAQQRFPAPLARGRKY